MSIQNVADICTKLNKLYTQNMFLVLVLKES